MARNEPRVAFRITDQLDADDVELWRDADREHAENAVRASRRRDDNQDPFTEEQLSEAESLLDQLFQNKARPDLFHGNRAGRAPAVVVDGDPLGDDRTAADRRTDEEYSAQLEGARPRESEIPMLSPAEFARCNGDPYARLCTTTMSGPVRKALSTAHARLQSLMLSETEHADVTDFMHSCGALTYIGCNQAADLYLFGIYANYGVVCKLSATSAWALQAYAFTSSGRCVRS